LLDGDLCKNYYDFNIFSIFFFWFSIATLSYTYINLTCIAAPYYYKPTYNIIVLILYSKLMKNLASLTVFNMM